MVKLQNQFKEVGQLELNGQDLGKLSLASVSDMTKGGHDGPKIGPLSAREHLKRGYFGVQRRSYLDENQRLTPRQRVEVHHDPTESSVDLIAELGGKLKQDIKGVGFASVEKAKFPDGEGYVNMWYRPTIASTRGPDFSKAEVIKGNGHRESLDDLIWRESLSRIRGTDLLVVTDAPERQFDHMKHYGFKPLKPKFGVPSTRAETEEKYAKRSDWIYLGLKVPQSLQAKYQVGIPLDKVFHLLNDYVREGFIDQSINVKGDRKFEVKRVNSAKRVYDNNIRRIIDSAVAYNGQVIVPFQDVPESQYKSLGLKPLSATDASQLKDKYLGLGNDVFQKVEYHPPDKK